MGYTVLLTVLVIALGTVFYHYAEGWSWVDSYYFSIITLTTVGYGDLSPTTPLSKIFTSFYIISGLGIIFSFMDSFFRYRLRLFRTLARKKANRK